MTVSSRRKAGTKSETRKRTPAAGGSLFAGDWGSIPDGVRYKSVSTKMAGPPKNAGQIDLYCILTDTHLFGDLLVP
jgi:hypothetical protein